jgi:hypothetical protein
LQGVLQNPAKFERLYAGHSVGKNCAHGLYLVGKYDSPYHTLQDKVSQVSNRGLERLLQYIYWILLTKLQKPPLLSNPAKLLVNLTGTKSFSPQDTTLHRFTARTYKTV